MNTRTTGAAAKVAAPASMNPIASNNQSAIIDDVKSFREIIAARMKELDWTTYRLAIACHAKGLHKVSVFRYIRGERDLTADNMMIVLDALGLKVCNGTRPKKLPRRSGDATA